MLPADEPTQPDTGALPANSPPSDHGLDSTTGEDPQPWRLRALKWYWQNFVKSFCFRLPLPLLLLFLFAITFNFIGESFGIVALVWQEDDLRRFVVGASMAVLVL